MHPAGEMRDLEDGAAVVVSETTPSRNTSANRPLITRPWREILRPEFPALFRNTPKLRATSHLDGLRGVAAAIVYLAHSEAWNHDVERIQHGFGYRGSYAFITLPFLRVFVTGGHAAVAVFFVISGFVLSQRPLSLMHHRSDEVYPVLSSAVFRRGVRLYAPFIVITVAFFLSWHLFRIELEWPKPQSSLVGEVVHWWNEFSLFANPFRRPDDAWFSYDFPLWTIPVEFQGSLLIFLTLLALARVSVRARLMSTALMALYFLHIGVWQMFCFSSGQILSELFLLDSMPRGASSSSSTSLGKTSDSPSSWALFLVAMYLAGQPSLKDISVAAETPGWSLLTTLVPSTYLNDQWWRFWPALSAPLLVYSSGQVSLVKAGLESRVAQYLGRISFALYLVHIPIANTLGDTVFRMIGYIRPGTSGSPWDNWFAIPARGPLGMELDFLVAQAVILPVTLYVSEFVTKLVDEPSVVLGKRLYDSVMAW